MSNNALIDQVGTIVSENQRLRVRVDGDAKTIHTITRQYDDLAANVDNIRAEAADVVADIRVWAEKEITRLTIERDQAVAKFEKIDTTLNEAANCILQGIRAAVGDVTPEKMPERKLAVIQDDRLPIARFQ